MPPNRALPPSGDPDCVGAMADRPQFEDREVALLADASFFPAKARISVKIRAALDQVHEALVQECRQGALLAPDGFDLAARQFVKGEHLEDHPYQYLDYPKHFQGETKFTFRTLIWWGHHAVFAWLLEGGEVETYQRRLLGRYQDVAGRGVWLSLAPTLWEWKYGEGFALPLKPDNRSHIAAVLDRRPHMKVMVPLRLDDAAFREGRLADAARLAFRAMFPIVGADDTRGGIVSREQLR